MIEGLVFESQPCQKCRCLCITRLTCSHTATGTSSLPNSFNYTFVKLYFMHIVHTLSSIINVHARLFFSRKKIHPTRSCFRAFYRQVASNVAYSFIDFKEIISVSSFILAYSFIRELRVNKVFLKPRKSVFAPSNTSIMHTLHWYFMYTQAPNYAPLIY